MKNPIQNLKSLILSSPATYSWQKAVGKAIKSLVATLSLTVAFFNTNVHAQIGGGLWQANGSSVVYTFRSVGIKTDSPTNDFHVNGSFRSNSAFIDSVLNSWEAIITDVLSVGGNLSVNGSSQFNGLVNFGSTLILNGANGSISSTTGTVDFLNSGLTTTGNISADTINGNVVNTSSVTAGDITTGNITANSIDAGNLSVSGNSQLGNLTADTITTDYLTAISQVKARGLFVTDLTELTIVQADSITAGYLSSNSINSGQYLLNGSPFTGSQWINSGSNIYFQGGNVGIGTTNPAFPFEVHGNAAITGTVFADRIEAQSHIGIGQFRFINGAAQPGQADTIRTPAALQVQAVGTMQLTTAEALKMQAAGTVTITSVSDTIKLAAGTVAVGAGGGPAPPPSPTPVALDVVGDVRASGSIMTNQLNTAGLNTDSIFVSGSITSDSIIEAKGFSGRSDLGFFADPYSAPPIYVMRGRINQYSGYMGLGASGVTPQDMLHLYEHNDPYYGNYEPTDPYNIFINFTNNHTGNAKYNGSRIGISQYGDLEIRQHHAGSPIRFWTTEFNTSILKEQMTITDVGRVGIGTVAPSGILSVTPSQYSIGTASQALNIVTGVGTTFTGAMVGSQFVFANGVSAGTITAFGSPTSLTVSTSQTVASQSYNISYTGLQVGSTGNVGIGTNNPVADLDVRGSINLRDNIISNDDGIIRFGNNKIHINYNLKSITWDALQVYPPVPGGDILGLRIGNGFGTSFGQNSMALGFNVSTSFVAENAIVIGSGTAGSSLITKTSNSLSVGFNSNIPTLFVGPSSGVGTTGVVRIGTETITSGTPHDDYKLSVDGKVVARKLVSTEVDWGDDEFDKKLTLDDLEEEERYVYEQGHLSGVPSGEEVRRDGIDHADMSERKIRKIEQIFMYLFDFKRIIQDLKKENQYLKHENLQFRNELSDLKKRIEVLEDKGK